MLEEPVMSIVDVVQLLDERVEMRDTEPTREMLFVDGLFPMVRSLSTIGDVVGLEVGDEVRFPRITSYIQ